MYAHVENKLETYLQNYMTGRVREASTENVIVCNQGGFIKLLLELTCTCTTVCIADQRAMNAARLIAKKQQNVYMHYKKRTETMQKQEELSLVRSCSNT